MPDEFPKMKTVRLADGKIVPICWRGTNEPVIFRTELEEKLYDDKSGVPLVHHTQAVQPQVSYLHADWWRLGVAPSQANQGGKK
jgi:hypothetical protein